METLKAALRKAGAIVKTYPTATAISVAVLVLLLCWLI
jgi:hypothetical protein